MGKAQILIFIVIIVIIAITGLFLFLRFRPSEDSSEKPVSEKLENVSENESQNNESLSKNESNLTESEYQNNESVTTPDEIVPSPSGITGIDLREDDGGYFCNETANPEHKARLYAYKIIDKVKILSENYTESEEIKNVCKNYPYINISEQNLRYNMRWEWQPVIGVNGYRIYQYYHLEADNITREYNYYIELTNQSTRLVDEGLDLWKKERD